MVVALYLFLLPKNPATSLMFSIGLGLSGDATVSPTSGIVNREFSAAKIATLIGFLFLPSDWRFPQFVAWRRVY
ncbi:hypothetical protein [Clostridium kluyveri]|uniref:hypothetical protein n=1 Tax=Clostridium kluyveri TaxID=1534 RepID=UPI0022461EEC|nr:hypothetical protein [Clostridium kluyveri]UZQ49516.1 hypothetical protein OP486_16405 [Clostridium kluyveri]